MLAHYTVLAITAFCMFALFLVLTRTLNSIINQFSKVEYLVRNAYEYKKERLDIQQMLATEIAELSEKEEDEGK
jgi:hypothetical protein